MLTKAFWIDAGERAVKTGAQFVVAAGVLAATDTLQSVDFQLLGGVFGLGAVLSLVTSVASSAVGDEESAAALPSAGGKHRL